jgi:hypothetical protein
MIPESRPGRHMYTQGRRQYGVPEGLKSYSLPTHR